MSSRRLQHHLFLPLFFLVFLTSVQTAEACSCGGRTTVLDSFNHADIVVVVTAMSVEKAEPEKTAPPGQMSNGENYVDGVKWTTMRVEQVFKGNLKVGAEMIFDQGGGADCIWTFAEESIGKKFLFYLNRFDGSGRWSAGVCGRSQRADYAGDDLLYLNSMNKVRNKTRISGTLSLYYQTDESLAGRTVRIIGPKETRELKTDENGVYEIYDLPAGRYLVEPEVPQGMKIAHFFIGYSPSLDRNSRNIPLPKIPIILEANKHAGLDIIFQVDNFVRGHIYDPTGQPMKGVCLDMIPADGSKGKYLADCTEKNGAFEIDEIPPGNYVIIVNDDGKMTSSEPFNAFYYPKTPKREEATVFNIGLGDVVENLEIYPPIELKTITVEGVLLYSDGKPAADERVSFAAVRKKPAQPAKTEGDEEVEVDEEDSNDAGAMTDANGRFSIKILQGLSGSLMGEMYTYVGEFENCPKLDRLVKQAGDSGEVKSTPVEIRATMNLYDVELKFTFPSCKKAKRR